MVLQYQLTERMAPIGLSGKDGANALTLKTVEGPAGVDGEDTDKKPRLDVNGESVATLNDGLKFQVIMKVQ